jgi:hypothetical protein
MWLINRRPRPHHHVSEPARVQYLQDPREDGMKLVVDCEKIRQNARRRRAARYARHQVAGDEVPPR